MKLSDIVNGPWAITDEMFAEVQGIYSRHCRGEKIDLAALEARIGAPLSNTRSDYQVQNGVAVIPIEGVIAKRMNLFMRISGGTSTQIAQQQIAQALADPEVSAIMLYVDSPGGTVDGTQALSDQIYKARGQKPIAAYTDGVMCSAAYWIASAADKVFIGGDTTMVGSIGVIGTHVDTSMADAQKGVRVTEIKAGKFKAVGSQNAPLGAGEVVMQEKIDQLYSVFLTDVARNRGVDVETVQQDMADGRVFVGRNAITAGLVDGVSTESEVIDRLSAGAMAGNSGPTRDGASAAASSTSLETEAMETITIEGVRANAPEVAKALFDDGATAGKAEGLKEGQAAGAASELARVKAVLAIPARGHEALRESLAFDGKTTAPEAALQILDAQDKARGKVANDLAADAGDLTVDAAAPADKKVDSKPENVVANAAAIAQRAVAYRAEQAAAGRRISEAEAVSHVMTNAA